MKAADFDYYRVDSLEDAIERLGELGEDAKVLAGGQSLVPMMNFRLARPAALVDITRVPELRGIERENGALRIRAATTHAEVEHAAELEGGYEVMRAAAKWVETIEDVHGRQGRWWSLHGLLFPDRDAPRSFSFGVGLDPLNPQGACEEKAAPALPGDAIRAALCEAARRIPR